MLEVVAALVWKEGRFLICRRPAHKTRGGQWEFAGGKVEPGETRAQALAREIREELAAGLNVGETAAETTYAYPDVTVHLCLMEAVLAAGEPRALEHSDIRWVTPDEAQAMDLCPADRILLNQIIEKNPGA